MFPLCLIRSLLHGIRYPMSMPLMLYQTIVNLFQVLPTTELEDKVVLITGANSGLGEALAHICYELGSYVILCGRKAEELQRVKEDLLQMKNNRSCPHDPIVLVMDLTKLSEMDDKVSKVLEICGRVDILINNAGIGYRGEVENTNIETDIRVMVTNYFGQVALTKAILPYMKQQHSGQIVVVSSVQGRISIPYRSSYSASKHALQAFFDCLRSEVEKDGISVCVVSPGYIHTNLSVHAVTGSGQTYGIMDPTTASGMQPRAAAFQIVKAMISHKKELILAPLSNKVAVVLRAMLPSAYFYIMSRRATQQLDSVRSLQQTTPERSNKQSTSSS